MRRIALVFGIMLTMAWACQRSHEYRQVVSMHDNGQPELVQIFNVKGTDTLLIKESLYWDNGNPRVEGGFDEVGMKDGIWTAYFENGNKWSEGNFKEGEADGDYRVWHENGQVYYEGSMSKGERTGKWRFYAEDGKLLKEIEY